MVKFCVEAFGNNLDEVIKMCKKSEELGYHAFYYGDGPWNYLLDCFSTLSYLSSLTSRIRLGPAVSNLFKGYREPIILAKASSTLDNISKGRFDLRVGCGNTEAKEWWKIYGYKYPKDRVSMLEEGLKILKELFLKDKVTYEGKYFFVKNAELQPKCYQKPHIPITIAAMGKRMIKIAQEYADILEISFLKPEEIKDKIDFPKILSLEIDVFIDKDREKALKEAKDYLSKNCLSIDYLERILLGNPEDICERINNYLDVGVKQFTLIFNQEDPFSSLEIFSDKVISNFFKE